MIPNEVNERFRELLRARDTPEYRRLRRRKDIAAGLMLIGLAIASPGLYMILGVMAMMSDPSPIGWTITAVFAAVCLWAGISIIAGKS